MAKHSHVIYVNTAVTGHKYWIRIRRNNQYVPYHPFPQQQQVPSPHPPHATPDTDGWVMVGARHHTPPKPPVEQPIYYWVITEHNLFDRNDKSFRLFFTEPDTTQIENVDQNNYMAIDQNQQLRLIHIHLKHKGMKMTPTYYVARTTQQVEDALQFVKYCVVKNENNEQKLIDLP